MRMLTPKLKTRLSPLAAALLLPLAPIAARAQDDAPVAIASPANWSTLRSDSVSVSLQADTSKLPKGAIDFKVVRRSGARSSVLFSKSVKVDDAAVDVFLGRVKGAPIGGGDFLSIEWSVPGTALKGVVEPVGVAPLSGSVSPENKWVPASPYLSAIKLKDGLSAEGAAGALEAINGISALWPALAAGWNASGLYLYFTPTSSVPAMEFALDLKCGANAFTALADRFVTAGADTVYGARASKRSVDKDGLKVEESPWGGGSIVFTKAGAGRLVKLDWVDLGVQPFEGRNIGFAVFTAAKGGGKGAAYPAGAARAIPGTWGGLTLAK